jgi:uroporphyrinogen decarboxylase
MLSPKQSEGTEMRGMSNPLFQKALARQKSSIPPIWLMRQAGRYHSHYRALREKHSFMDLCKVPELAAEVAMGPIQDFDFDVAILFSDLLFPLEGLGFGLSYDKGPPELGWHLSSEKDFLRLKAPTEALPALEFQREAVRQTRERLPSAKSLIGFVGGPWTLFSYACQGSHDGSLISAKTLLPLYAQFCERFMIPLLKENIQLQLSAGAEIVMLFDTAAGELSPAIYQAHIVPTLKTLLEAFPNRLGYYSKGTQRPHLNHPLFSNGEWAGLGFDHRWALPEVFSLRSKGFVQGNFDQALLFSEKKSLVQYLDLYLRTFETMSETERAGWVCGLGHGVLPKTPEDNVRLFVETVRRRFGS